MKKLFALLLTAVLAMATLVGCSSGIVAGTPSANNSDSAKEEATEGDKTPAEEKVTAKVIDIALSEEEYAYGVDKDQPELLAQVNEFIQEIKADGTFDAICDRYFGEGTPVAVKSAELDDSKDQLVVATNAAFEPFEYMDGEDYYGVDMEIAAALAEKLGKELVISNMEFASVCLSVGEHKCDIAMAGLTVKEERKEFVDFSESYYNAAQNLIVLSNDPTFDECTTADEVAAILQGFDDSVKIGTQNGTTGQLYVEGDEDWGFPQLPVTGVGYSNGSLAVQDMLNGNISYVIIDSAPAHCITEALNQMR